MTAPSAAYTSSVIAFAALKVREANRSSGIIGCGERRSTSDEADPRERRRRARAGTARSVCHSISQ